MNSYLHSYLKRRNALLPRASGSGPWLVAPLCKAYGWPTNAPGGKPIAIVELGGGYVASDLQLYANANSLPLPNITDVSVDGTTNSPGGDADAEVALDIMLAWSSYFYATGGKVPDIRMYFSQDIPSAVQKAAADGCGVCSISWGADEANWGTAAVQAMEAAAAAAIAAGMIVFAAAGDNDSSDGGPGAANVDCPASCPSVVGCGGTSKTPTSETVWNNNPGNADGSGTGGGYSTVFPMPTWQSANGASTGPGRMVPDLAANADPNTGYEIYVGGQAQVVGGTSAVAPLIAGLFAALGANGVGGANPTIWASRGCFTLITQGNNGQYQASDNPDPCTGLGTPIGTMVAGLYAASSGTGAGAPAPAPSPTPAPVAPTAAEAIAWACSQLPGVFMSKGSAEKHIAAGINANWPK
jgi:kumamolisin